MTRWQTSTRDGGDHVHVLPIDDSVPHAEDDDAACVCGPTVEPVFREDGSSGWLIIHHSLDNREAQEAR